MIRANKMTKKKTPFKFKKGDLVKTVVTQLDPEAQMCIILERYSPLVINFNCRVYADDQVNVGDFKNPEPVKIKGNWYSVLIGENVHDYCPESMFVEHVSI